MRSICLPAFIDTGLAALTFDERQQFLRLLVKKITYEDRKAKVEVVFPRLQVMKVHICAVKTLMV